VRSTSPSRDVAQSEYRANRAARLESAEQTNRKVVLLKSVAHPIRLGILNTLARGPMRVGALAAGLDVPQPLVSQQLRILRMTGIVSVDRHDGFAVYSLREPQLRVLLNCIENCCREP
jgi:DNA-binding transcriptional ArsR family regulator